MPTNPDSDVLLDVRDLKVHYGLRGSFTQRLLGQDIGSVRAVDGVSLQLRRGEVLGLVGESGSGKTTLGRAVLGLTPATSGEITFDGERISGLSERQFRPLRRRLQMVFQDSHASLNPSMTLLEAIGHPLRIHGIASDARSMRQAVSESMERVGLVPVERFWNKYPGDLSGWQKQRAVLARAIILSPELVVADEPVSISPPLGCSFHPRCQRAFEPCGWESRDLRTMLEARWAELSPEEFQHESRLMGNLTGLARPSRVARVLASSGHTGADIAKVLQAHREEHADEPMWRGVAATSADRAGCTLEFLPHSEPVLRAVSGGHELTQVACHLYRDDLAKPAT